MAFPTANRHGPTGKAMSQDRRSSGDSIDLDNIPLDMVSRSSNESSNSGGGSQPSPATFSLLSSQGGVAAGRPLGVPDRFGLQSLPQHEDRGQQGGDRRDRTRYMNNDSLAHDLSFLATMPELCDVTFLVGEGREAVCAVRAILAARSRVFRRMLYSEDRAGFKKVKKKNIKPSSDSHIEMFDFKGHPTIVIKDFEPEVFKQLVTYTHTGSVILQARTLLGLMNAADHYDLDELKQACIQFMEHCVTVDTVCSLLTSAEKYIQYKSTKILVQKMLEFVDTNAESILSLGAFTTLPQHVVRIVLSREYLHTSETKKFEAAYQWCLHHCENDMDDGTIKQAFEPFVDVIDFRRMSASTLMKSVKPANVVNDTVILTALAYQADPSSVDPIRPHSSASVLKSSNRETISIDFRRRVQSSGNPLDVEYGPGENKPCLSGISSRGRSVPPPLGRSQDMIHLRGVTNPIRLQDARGSRNSRSSSHLSTPPFSPLDSYHGSSTLSSGSSCDQDHHGNDLSEPRNCISLSQPNLFEGRPSKQQLTYDPHTLDTIVTLSSTNTVEV